MCINLYAKAQSIGIKISDEYILKPENLQESKNKKTIPEDLNLTYFKSFYSQFHLYNPLLFKNGKSELGQNIKITPIELNEGEIKL